MTKPGKLTDEEFEIMKTHTTYGTKMLQYTIDKMTGEDAGYLIEAKNVADVFDALVSRRSYKEPFSFEEAINIIKEDSGTHFDPFVVEAFLSAEENGTTYAYMHIGDASYYIEDGKMVEGSASSTAYKVKFINGEPVSYENPTDGAGQDEDYKRLFPTDVAGKMMTYNFDFTRLDDVAKAYYKL